MSVVAATESTVHSNIASAGLQWNHGNWDRRSSPRLELDYKLRLRAVADGREAEAQTVNVSIDGFCFHSSATFQPQEELNCEMILPWSDSGSGSVELAFHGRVRVCRVAPLHGGTFAIGCRFEGRYTIDR